jgi:hypothetical protein
LALQRGVHPRALAVVVNPHQAGVLHSLTAMIRFDFGRTRE